MLLDNKNEISLRPMKYPYFFDAFKDSVKNFWTVDELDFQIDLSDLRDKLTVGESHLIKRLVAFFATADTIVANNLVLSIYKSFNSPEYRMFLGKQLFDEMVHVQAYLLLVESYISDEEERLEAFRAVDRLVSVKAKAEYMKSFEGLSSDWGKLLNLIVFAACVEGLFFFGSFAYVYFLRSKGLLPGLAAATNWIFRDESMHMEVAFQMIDEIRKENPELFNDQLKDTVIKAIKEAVDLEVMFAEDALSEGVTGLSVDSVRQYLEYVADLRLTRLGYNKEYGSTNPFAFMELQDVVSHTNFFEKKVTEYQKGLEMDSVSFDGDF